MPTKCLQERAKGSNSEHVMSPRRASRGLRAPRARHLLSLSGSPAETGYELGINFSARSAPGNQILFDAALHPLHCPLRERREYLLEAQALPPGKEAMSTKLTNTLSS